MTEPQYHIWIVTGLPQSYRDGKAIELVALSAEDAVDKVASLLETKGFVLAISALQARRP